MPFGGDKHFAKHFAGGMNETITLLKCPAEVYAHFAGSTLLEGASVIEVAEVALNNTVFRIPNASATDIEIAGSDINFAYTDMSVLAVADSRVYNNLLFLTAPTTLLNTWSHDIIPTDLSPAKLGFGSGHATKEGIANTFVDPDIGSVSFTLEASL